MSTLALATALLDATDYQRGAILPVLLRYGHAAISLVNKAKIRIRALRPTESYRQISPSLRRLNLPIDSWPYPPAGLFVVEERTMYLRSCSTMTVAHEFGHAIDCALGQGRYYSELSATVQAAFRAAEAWITPYAATRIDEYFAESLRGYIGANDPRSPWPAATRVRLRRLDPLMARHVEMLFKNDFKL